MLHLQDRLPVLRASLNRQQFEALNNSWRSNLTTNKLDRIIRDLVRAFKPPSRPPAPRSRPPSTLHYINANPPSCHLPSNFYLRYRFQRGVAAPLYTRTRAYYAYSTNSLNDVNLIVRESARARDFDSGPRAALAHITPANPPKRLPFAPTGLTVSQRNLSLSRSSPYDRFQKRIYTSCT